MYVVVKLENSHQVVAECRKNQIRTPSYRLLLVSFFLQARSDPQYTTIPPCMHPWCIICLCR